MGRIHDLTSWFTAPSNIKLAYSSSYRGEAEYYLRKPGEAMNRYATAMVVKGEVVSVKNWDGCNITREEAVAAIKWRLAEDLKESEAIIARINAMDAARALAVRGTMA